MGSGLASLGPSRFDWREWTEIGQPWTATTFSLTQLPEFGLHASSESAKRAVALIGANSRWDQGTQPYWEGEVEECINGRTVADGAYFGIDVSPIVTRLLDERLDDGGWNCERVNGSVRSPFATTLNVLEGLLEYERATGGTPASRRRGPRVRSTSWNAGYSVASAIGNRQTSSSCYFLIRTDGTTTSSGRWITSALLPY